MLGLLCFSGLYICQWGGSLYHQQHVVPCQLQFPPPYPRSASVSLLDTAHQYARAWTAPNSSLRDGHIVGRTDASYDTKKENGETPLRVRLA